MKSVGGTEKLWDILCCRVVCALAVLFVEAMDREEKRDREKDREKKKERKRERERERD